jgi:hypothetical protein
MRQEKGAPETDAPYSIAFNPPEGGEASYIRLTPA